MYRLNISNMNPDTELQETLDQIYSEKLANGALGAADSVESWVKNTADTTTERELSVELVAHARGGVLALGSWTVNDRGTTAQKLAEHCAAALLKFQSKRILLLGCNTAMTRAGQQAISHLAGIFGPKVAGTTVPIWATDFDANGIAANVLAWHGRLPPAVRASEKSAKMVEWFDRFKLQPELDFPAVHDNLRRETLQEATRDWQRTYPQHRWPVRQLENGCQFQSCFSWVVAPLRSAPGLLALPELELLAPVAGAGGRYHRLTVLLEGHVMRVYPQGYPGGVLLRAPSSLLNNLPAGTEIPALRPVQPRRPIQ